MILRYTNTTTSKYSSKFFTLVQCLIIVRDYTVTNRCFTIIHADNFFTLRFYNTNSDRACENRACGHMIFAYFFKLQ